MNSHQEQPKNISEVESQLMRFPRKWLITGAAGFIGSHIVEKLLKLNQTVVGIDNLSSGSMENLSFCSNRSFEFIQADVENVALYKKHLPDTDFILHEAATASVEKCENEAAKSYKNNTLPILHLLEESGKRSKAKLIYASSAAVYGNPQQLPLDENSALHPISLYGLAKKNNEEMANSYRDKVSNIGLRYFNVYGNRQSPDSAYSGVISIFLRRMKENQPIYIFGDGENTRDFVHVSDIVQANLLAAVNSHCESGTVLNIGTGKAISILDLVRHLSKLHPEFSIDKNSVIHKESRTGDIRHSVSSIKLARDKIGYEPSVEIGAGLKTLVTKDLHG